jgi:hypothetical protein
MSVAAVAAMGVAAALNAATPAGGGSGVRPAEESATGLGGEVTANMDFYTGDYQIIIRSGSPSSPAIVFGADNDGTPTGIYRYTTNSFGFVCNNSVCLSIGPSVIQLGADLNVSNRSVYSNTGAVQINDELNVSGIASDGSGKAACVKADGDLGTCTDAVGVGGTCTCN